MYGSVHRYGQVRDRAKRAGRVLHHFPARSAEQRLYVQRASVGLLPLEGLRRGSAARQSLLINTRTLDAITADIARLLDIPLPQANTSVSSQGEGGNLAFLVLQAGVS